MKKKLAGIKIKQ